MTQQSNWQRLATLALQQTKTDLYSSINDLLEAVKVIIVTGTEGYDPKQIMDHLWSKVAEIEKDFLKDK